MPNTKRCTNCNREMGYKPPSDECAPCALGFTPRKLDPETKAVYDMLDEKFREECDFIRHMGDQLPTPEEPNE